MCSSNTVCEGVHVCAQGQQQLALLLVVRGSHLVPMRLAYWLLGKLE